MRNDRPNIVLILTDQQQAGMMSCAGNPYLRTPNMDALAGGGIRFDRAYSSNPVCLPARVSMVTGHYPGRFGISYDSDWRVKVPRESLDACLPWVLQRAGYDTWFGGKGHWASNMTPASIGFQETIGDQRDELADAAAAFIRARRDRPFFLSCAFINPHDICFLAIDDYTRANGLPVRHDRCSRDRQMLAQALSRMDGRTREEFATTECPPLRPNHGIPEGEPDAIGMDLQDFRVWARANWTAADWRVHRYAYCRLTESVDEQVGRVLGALSDAGIEENTLVLLTCDHGDLDGAHRLEHKDFFYEECARVPFVLRYPAAVRGGQVDGEHLVGASTDLFPTVCDFAGVEPPAGLPGRSVRALAAGRAGGVEWRDSLLVECRNGRMVRTARHKYASYAVGANSEWFVDTASDPGEMVNLVGRREYSAQVEQHRALLGLM
jgi:choline-sulfatase